METHTQKNINVDVKGQSEDALQQKCFFWFWNSYPHLRGLLFSVPNGGSRSGKEGKKFNLTGLTSGVSDLCLLFNGKAYFIELKSEKGSQSKTQKSWQDIVESQGFNYFLIYSLVDFKTLLINIVE